MILHVIPRWLLSESLMTNLSTEQPQISDLDTSSDMNKNADDPARLECFATGRPQPIITWTRMAGELLPNGGTEFQVRESSFGLSAMFWCSTEMFICSQKYACL